MPSVAEKRVDYMLAATFREAIKVWIAMRADKAPLRACVDALARSLKAAWPERVPYAEWPEQYRQPRCPQCDGYGLIIREVTNRLGCQVRDGTPCVCWAGDKFKPKAPSAQDFTAAGKTAEKKGFRRWDG